MKIKALRTKSASYSEDRESFTTYFSLIQKEKLYYTLCHVNSKDGLITSIIPNTNYLCF